MDDILQLRDYFYAGYNNYCLKIYENVGGEDQSEAQEYIYQIYMSDINKKNFVLKLKNEKNENLYFLYLYYKYYYLNERDENILNEMKSLKTTSNMNILKSRIFFDHDLLDECFDMLEDGTIEMKALKIFLLLHINRFDLAKELITDFLKIHEEIPIVKIAIAIYYFFENNYKESFLLFDDIESLHSSITNDTSSIIVNGKSIASILSYEFQDAKECLNNSLKNEVVSNDTLYNLITCSLYLYEMEEAETYLNDLYASFPEHESVSMLKKIDQEIDNFVSDF